MSDYYVEQAENSRIGIIGSDRMALGLSSLPNPERGDMDKVKELKAEIAALKADKIDQLTRIETAKLHDAYAEIARLRQGHCKDCCCARSWEALGGQTIPGGSIPQHIEELVEEIAALREAVRNIHNLAAAPTSPERINEDWPTLLCKRLGEIRMISSFALEEKS